MMSPIRLSCLFLTAAAACARPDLATAPQPAPAPASTSVAACDAGALASAATRIEGRTRAWSPAEGTLPLFAEEAATAIRAQCPALRGAFDRVLDRVLDDERRALGLPMFAADTDDLTAVCPNFLAVADQASQQEAADRPAVLYDGCHLERFEQVVTRNEAVAAGLASGAITLLALGEHLQRAGVPATTSHPLTRALVLSSGLAPRPPDDLRLPPAAEEGTEPLADGFAITIAADVLGVGPVFAAPRPEERSFLGDRVAELPPGEPRFILADRHIPWSRAQEIADVARGNGAEPRLVVLTDTTVPWRALPIPSATGIPTHARVIDVVSTAAPQAN